MAKAAKATKGSSKANTDPKSQNRGPGESGDIQNQDSAGNKGAAYPSELQPVNDETEPPRRGRSGDGLSGRCRNAQTRMHDRDGLDDPLPLQTLCIYFRSPCQTRPNNQCFLLIRLDGVSRADTPAAVQKRL